ncbi:MAG: nuclear transport factor 2 family protein [Mesorhizobium sp.]|nr:MAG: nuclear transport factor 2 family protein [Mesorhizobium sp.]
MSDVMSKEQLQSWVARYKQAWETQDADLFVTLFARDCEYRETPFMEPVPGRELHAFWQALAERQQDNHIVLEILCQPSPDRVLINWQAETTRRGTSEQREGNGIFLLTFSGDRCSDVLEWQHWHGAGEAPDKASFTWKKA